MKEEGQGWRGISLFQLEEDKESQVILEVGALGRRYSFQGKRKMQKIIIEPIKGYFFSLHFWKNKPFF